MFHLHVYKVTSCMCRPNIIWPGPFRKVFSLCEIGTLFFSYTTSRRSPGSTSSPTSRNPTMPTVEPTNPLKRRRTEDELEDDPLRMSTDSDSNAQSDATRSEVWFDDGSVVLQAANVQFKVHRSVLCRHSSVFRDVFSMPHPRDEPTVDSCPVIHLQDSAEDLKHMLLALYDK